MEQNKDQSSTAVRGEAVALTDADIVEIARVVHADGRLSWLGFDKDENDAYTVPILSKCHFQLVRAVLAAVKSRAADAPSAPSEVLARDAKWDGFDSSELGQAQSIAWTIWRDNYRDDAPDFCILSNVKGVLSQIDNMVCGLSRAADALDSQPTDLHRVLVIAEAALSDIGDADREPGDDLAWCEARAAKALPTVRAALAKLASSQPTELPPVAPLAPDGWISVDDRLPDDDSHVLVASWRYITGEQRITSDHYSHGLRCFSERDVTHWMPIPLAPASSQPTDGGVRNG